MAANSTVLAVHGLATMSDNAAYVGAFVGRFIAGTNEANCKLVLKYAGTFSQFKVRVKTNTVTVATNPFDFRVDGADSALTIPIGPGVTGLLEDNAHSVHLDAGQSFNWRCPVASESGAHSIVAEMASVRFTPDDPTKSIVVLGVSGASPNRTVDSATGFMAFGGTTQYGANGAGVRWTARSAATLEGFQAIVEANARTTLSTARVRVNGANGTQLADYLSTATGSVQDVTHADALVAGDTANFSVDTDTGGNSIQFSLLAVHVVSTLGKFPFVAALSNGESQPAATTRYYGLASNLDDPETTDAAAATVIPFALTLSDLNAMVTSNTGVTTPATVTVYKNGAPTGLVLSIGTIASATVITESSPTSVSFIAGDTASIEVVNGEVALALVMTWLSLLATVAGGGAVPVMMSAYRRMRS